MKKMMKKRGGVGIDSVPRGDEEEDENGKIIGGFGGRMMKRRKNFSLILFLGLSALVCALYYTSYYPGAGVGGAGWTLRLGVTSRTTQLGGNDGGNNGGKASNNNKEEEKVERRRSQVISTLPSTTLGTEEDTEEGSGGNLEESTAREDNEKEISTEKTWKYWEALKYWENSMEGDGGNEEGMPADGGSDGGKVLCNFPRLNPFDPSITDFIKSPPAIDCRKAYPLVFRTNFRNKLIQIANPFSNASLEGTGGKMEDGDKRSYTCCYKTITRGNGSDHNVIFSKRCYRLVHRETEIPADHEFISIRCRPLPSTGPTPSPNSSTPSNKTLLYKDLLAFVPLKPAVESRIRKYSELQRKLHYRQPSHPSKDHPHLSVVVLGLDAQSHMNFIRQMPLSYTYLTRNLSALGLHGYTKVGDNTFPNVVTLLSGLSVDELVSKCWPSKDSFFDSCPFLWKNYSESGYRTSFVEDSVWMGTFNYEKKGFLKAPTDYYFHPLSLLMAKKIGHETWANAKLCYGPRLAFDVLLDYLVKTAVTFRDSLYFQFIWANSLFHDYLNNPQLGDESLLLTLQFLKTNGFLNNTAFVLLSDHGIRWGSIRSTYQGKIEERMPMAYFYFPEWFWRRYPEARRNFRGNAWRLTTPYDVHETLKDILRLSRGEEGGDFGGRGVGRGVSLFREVPRERTCKMAGVEEHWCVCHGMENVPLNGSLVGKGAAFLVGVVNGLVGKWGEKCAKLELEKVNEARRKIDGEVDRGGVIDMEEMEEDPSKKKTDDKKTVQLQLVIVTVPGHAVFEGTIYGELGGIRRGEGEGYWRLSGDISRLNLYGEQSACVEDYAVQKYCYCSNLENAEKK